MSRIPIRHKNGFSKTCFAGICLILMLVCSHVQGVSPEKTSRWMGHDFVFCFISDDGTRCNLGWAEIGMERDFRFTIAVNADRLIGGGCLTASEVSSLADVGFDIGNHSTSHAHHGMTKCDNGLEPPYCDLLFGDLRGYFCFSSSFADSSESMEYYRNEISRGPLSNILYNVDADDIQSFVYPGQGHSKAIVADIYAWGYLGARNGVRSSDHSDYENNAENSWDGGISLFRVPVVEGTGMLFGNHSSDPPVHFTHEQFVEATIPYIEKMRESGGIMAVMAHHYGDDDSCHGTSWGYGYGGMTDEELGWIVDLVRENNGIVMTFSDALEFYRDSAVLNEIDGDLVWVHAPVSIALDNVPSKTITLDYSPNPFNPKIEFNCRVRDDESATLVVYDLVGRSTRLLFQGTLKKGSTKIFWNGTDDQGRYVPSGTYLAVLQTLTEKRTSKITLVR